MNKRCDLHTHSTFSDGTFTPSQIIDEAIAQGISAVALTDHNTVTGLKEFMSYAEGKDIIAVPGIEFSTGYEEKELHIVGLFISEKYYEIITNKVKHVNDLKDKSNIALINALGADGYELDYKKIKASTPGGQVNRAHIAAEMTKKGYVGSIDEAFSTLLSSKGKYYRPPERLTSFETIEFIRSIGALPILAHPFLNLDEQRLRRFLSEAKQYGLAGMETMYSKYSEETTLLARSIAKEYSLLESGGSDFHGENKPKIALGSGMENLDIPISVYETLKDNLK